MSYLVQVDDKHICHKVLKTQHDQETLLASTRGVLTEECASMKLWARSSPVGVVYTPHLQVSMSYQSRWMTNTYETIVVKSQHNQATPSCIYKGSCDWRVWGGGAVGPFQPSRGCLHTKTCCHQGLTCQGGCQTTYAIQSAKVPK